MVFVSHVPMGNTSFSERMSFWQPSWLHRDAAMRTTQKTSKGSRRLPDQAACAGLQAGMTNLHQKLGQHVQQSCMAS